MAEEMKARQFTDCSIANLIRCSVILYLGNSLGQVRNTNPTKTHL